MATFGERLKQAREGAGLTQAGLGAQIGKPKQNVWDWETGRAQPSLDTITKLAEALNVSAGWLAFGEERTMIQKLAADQAAVGIHGITGQPIDTGTLMAGTLVRDLHKGVDTSDPSVPVWRFDASTDGGVSWYRQMSYWEPAVVAVG